MLLPPPLPEAKAAKPSEESILAGVDHGRPSLAFLRHWPVERVGQKPELNEPFGTAFSQHLLFVADGKNHRHG
jgi:hypothetical protein